MKRNCLIILLLALCLPPSIFCQTIEIENKIAGELHNQITDHSVTNLTIKGHINRTDLDFINSELRQLKSLNLKNTFIDAYQDPDDYEFGYYAANIFPSSFSANSSIEKLILPVSLKGMGVSCLNNPSQLTHLVSYSEIPPVADEDYPYIGNPDFLNRCVLLVPNNSIDTYRNAPGWNFATIMPIADESDEPGKPQEKYILSTDKLVLEKWLSDDETVDMSSIKELQRVKTIGKDAFGSLTRANNVLKKIILSENIQKIDDYAFANCNALKEIVFNPKINFLGVGAFFNCKSLKSIELPNSITDIERASFSGCAALASVSLSNSLQTLSNSIFYGCIYNHRTTKTNQKYPSVNL